MKPQIRRVLHAVALAAIWRWAETLAFATPQTRCSTRDLMSRSVPNVLSVFFDAAQDPAVQAAWATVASKLTSAAQLLKSCQQVQKFASEWKKQAPFEGEDAQDAKKHASELAGEIEKAVTAGQNVLIPFAQEEDLPLLPIRGTPFEKLMVATLRNTSMIGVYAVHAEPGAGKSTAAALAALELLGRQTKDIIMLLQNDFERQLKSFLRLSNVEFTAEIVRPLFTILKEKGIRLKYFLTMFWMVVFSIREIE